MNYRRKLQEKLKTMSKDEIDLWIKKNMNRTPYERAVDALSEAAMQSSSEFQQYGSNICPNTAKVILDALGEKPEVR